MNGINEAAESGEQAMGGRSADDEYSRLLATLRDIGWSDWFRLDMVVGERLSDACDILVNSINRRLIDVAEKMESECSDPPCKHAQGLRLAISYIEDERLS